MTRRIAFMFLSVVPLLAGWMFLRRSATVQDAYVCDTDGGRSRVTVRFTGAAATAAADEAEAALAADGWKRAPVCTPTFRLLMRGEALTALLAEDVGGRTRITTLQTRNDLW